MPHDENDEAKAVFVNRVIGRLARFGALEESEKAHLIAMGGRVRQLERGATIQAEGMPTRTLDLLLDGWAASAVGLSDGSRQLVMLNLPGDLLGLPGLAVQKSIDTVIALSSVVVVEIQADSLLQMFWSQPGLAAKLYLVAQEERVMAMERLALVGKAPALARVAALFVRLGERLAKLGCGSEREYEIPLTQKDLADLVGVTAVHLNKLLRELRSAGIITLQKRQLRILKEQELWDIAQIEPWNTTRPFPLPEAAGGK